MELATLVRDFGVPVAFLVIALLTGRAGMWAWGRELAEANRRTAECEERWRAQYDAAVAEWRERLRLVEEDYEERLAKEEAVGKRWETLTLEAHGIARVAAHALDKAVK